MYEKKPWLKYYDSHTPESIDYPNKQFMKLFMTPL